MLKKTVRVMGLLQHRYAPRAVWGVRHLAQGHIGRAQYMYWHLSRSKTIFHTWSDQDFNSGPYDSQPIQSDLLPPKYCAKVVIFSPPNFGKLMCVDL